MNDFEEFPVMRLNPLNLTFAGESAQLEQNFLRDYTSKSVKYIRLAFLPGIFLYSIFGILDAILMPEKKAIVWFIRFFAFGKITLSRGIDLFTAGNNPTVTTKALDLNETVPGMPGMLQRMILSLPGKKIRGNDAAAFFL